LRLFQTFSFLNSYLALIGKTGPLPVFPRACSKTNRVLEQALLPESMNVSKTDAGRPVAGLVLKAYDTLKDSNAAGAAELLEEALTIDFESAEVKYALKCVRWWLDQIKRLPETHNPYERGGLILSRLKQYYVFLDRCSPAESGEAGGASAEAYDQCQYAVRRYVFSSALRCFEDLLGERVNQHDPGLLFLVGRCYKGVGNYIEALKYLEQAIHFRREDAETLAELADVNALLGEDRIAKAYFREAFFLEPGKIDLRSMEAELILRLRDRVARERGYRGDELNEWIPVWGGLWGVFSIKRELKQVEAGRLKQSIFSLEAERVSNPERDSFLKPRLLNRYFWLVDHYENIREDPALIEELLLKIKITDPEIYERYIR
jgi:tetratricopeptide (TPR) repeat protein